MAAACRDRPRPAAPTSAGALPLPGSLAGRLKAAGQRGGTAGRTARGSPNITGGALTISSLCAEAGISRAAYYRSPAAAIIRELLAAGQGSRPEIDILRSLGTSFSSARKPASQSATASLSGPEGAGPDADAVPGAGQRSAISVTAAGGTR
jgi:hypothetical protein